MSDSFPRAGFVKRLLVIVYDLLAVIALLMLTTVANFIVISLLEGNGLIKLNGYVDHSAFLNNQWWFQAELVLVTWFFYTWFWYDGGQTLGMRAWRLKIQSTNGKPLTLKRTAIRALFALGGLGNILVLFTPKNKLSLQDKISNTEVVLLTKEANKRVYLRGVEDPNQTH
ncbi:RDD family protein [Psychrosphaera sp. B3R10]|uniref:RDD family protein n=1 Tax=Psychrosphaera algicola TaxID=3023714 RepID=A0ABT5FD58_9GAMM|nr:MULTISPECIES: RDD family protein [unclassified Psychrosphaera]MBU2883918.1 RDD family protein [Psychrosphaera sp. I2R16]MBU2991577.1 RDD family protein [Psychrosphaera sp. B3R10]MDC2888984.1 RDD family protein [Psychrosphaera sp. G1-22]